MYVPELAAASKAPASASASKAPAAKAETKNFCDKHSECVLEPKEGHKFHHGCCVWINPDTKVRERIPKAELDQYATLHPSKGLPPSRHTFSARSGLWASWLASPRRFGVAALAWTWLALALKAILTPCTVMP